MDQLASELKMSKKTIYSIFSSKEEIMRECILHVNNQLVEKRKQLKLEDEKDIVGLLRKKTEIIAHQLQFLSNELVIELQQDYPQLWNMIDELRTESLKENEKIIAKGVELGILKSIDPKIIMHMHQTCIREFTNQEFLIKHNLTMSQACHLVMSIILEGLLVEKSIVSKS